MRATWLVALGVFAVLGAAPAAAQEVFVGGYAHGVNTPFTLDTGERGMDFVAGYRFAPIERLAFIGKPAPYLIGSLNRQGATNFAGAGLAWKIGQGPVYLRPGVGIVIHDGPSYRVNAAGDLRTDLGSRVLFEPEIAVGTRLTERLAIEASWVHISHARLFDAGQNPGIDMIGLRLGYALH